MSKPYIRLTISELNCRFFISVIHIPKFNATVTHHTWAKSKIFTKQDAASVRCQVFQQRHSYEKYLREQLQAGARASTASETRASSCVDKPGYLQIAEGDRDSSGYFVSGLSKLNSCVLSMHGYLPLLFVLCMTNQAVFMENRGQQEAASACQCVYTKSEPG